MYKKIIALLLVLVLAVALVACGNNNTSDDPNNNSQNTQAGDVENENNNNNKENNDKGKTNLSQTLTFMGYKIGYPEGVSMSNSDYGQTFRFNSEIAVLIEAPSVAGVMLDVKSLDDVVSTSEEYVVKTFENTVRELFSFGATTQNVARSEKKTINGIEMLRVEGEFSNTAKNTTIAYVGYYFLLDTDPVYIVGVPMNENASADEFIDQIANSIKK